MTLLSGCLETIKTQCPQLRAIPPELRTLLDSNKNNPAIAAYTIDLSKHRDKLKECR